METVSFVILHYGDRKITDTCVQSILKMEHQERIRLVIVDNDIQKSGRERKALAASYEGNPRISVLTIKENGGFSYANNQGYRYAREELESSYIIILNNDIEFPQRDFLKRLDESRGRYPCHILGPDIVRAGAGEHQNPMDVRLRTAEEARYTVRMNRLALAVYPAVYPLLRRKLKKEEEKKLRRKKEDEKFYQEIQENIVPFGACLVFTPDFVEKEELAFVPETRFFYEEYILVYRCQKKKYRIVYDPSLKVLHENGASTRKTYRNEKKRIKFMMERTKEAAEIYLETITGG